jgi:hypothetical protein
MVALHAAQKLHHAAGVPAVEHEELPATELVPLHHQLLPPSLAAAFGIKLLPQDPAASGSGPGPAPAADAARAAPRRQPPCATAAAGTPADQVLSTSENSSEREAEQQQQAQQQQAQQQQEQQQALMLAMMQGPGLASYVQHPTAPLPAGPGPNPGMCAPFSAGMQGAMQLPFMGFDTSQGSQQMPPGENLPHFPAPRRGLPVSACADQHACHELMVLPHYCSSNA